MEETITDMDSKLRTFWDSVRKMAERMDSRQKELVARLEACVSSGGRKDASQREGITGVWHGLDCGSACSNEER